MDVSYNPISARITVSVQLKDLSLQERRRIFSELLLDEETNPGQAKLPPQVKHAALLAIDGFCGWKEGA